MTGDSVSTDFESRPPGPESKVIGIEEPFPIRRERTNDPNLVINYRRLSLQISETHRSETSSQRGEGRTAEEAYFDRLDFQTKEASDLCKAFNVDPSRGLENGVADTRKQRDGPNVLSVQKPKYIWKLLKYIFGGFCSILWIGVVVFFICWRPPLSNPPSPTNLALAILILIVILFQASFSAFEDWSTGRVMHSILDLIPADCVVIRNGSTATCPAADLVVGDIVKLKSGDKVPADMRIIEGSADLAFDRSILTGESEDIRGTAEAVEDTFLEAKNIALMGTYVTTGSAIGMVVLTGSRTVIGKISILTSNAKEQPTLIQREITRFVYIICGMTLTLIVIILIVWGVWLRKDHPGFINVAGILSNCMGLVVAFIPEGMPMAVTLTLSLVARRMKAKDVLPKSLSTVETLGCVTVLCSDKTGTLTQNKMFVQSVSFADRGLTSDEAYESSLEKDLGLAMMHQASLLCNDAKFDPESAGRPVTEREIIGNATDAAVLRFASVISQHPLDPLTHVFTVPFNSTNKWMMSVYSETKPSDLVVFCKGAPDVIMKYCDSYWSDETGAVESLSESARQRIMATQAKLASSGQRVIALCSKRFTQENKELAVMPQDESYTEYLCNLTIIGLLGIIDPPREDIPETVASCRKAGARFFMVTGDFKLTAAAIARQVGIITTSNDPDAFSDVEARVQNAPSDAVWRKEEFLNTSLVLEGSDLEVAVDEHWDAICCYEEVVFSRTTPEQKLRIVEAYKSRDEVVAVTGDGVNDAPALKAADVGIAVVSGSDVALEAAHLILLGDFSSIVDGIRLGRLVFQNLQKVIGYLLPAGSYSEIWPVLINVFFGVPLPLSSFLMIIICVFTDLAQCLTIVMEKAEFDLLSMPPRDAKKDHLINLRIYGQVYGFVGTMEAVTAHAMFFFYMWRAAKIPISDLFFAYEHYTDGFHGYTQQQLNEFNYTGQSVYFVTLVILQWGNLLSVRNRKLSILQADPIRKERRNVWIPLGACLGFVIAIFVTEVPWFQNIFNTRPVPVEFWLIPLPLAFGILVMDEIRKVIARNVPAVEKYMW
ncbi:calcium-transporting ATPase 1 [Trichomonascus vanleenenianus]|uniref:cation-translocating P-type ATPase n=1 Tax=Trichomonascus vanleenenianus TaxID=2268995 RepID=UPI003ECB6BC3